MLDILYFQEKVIDFDPFNFRIPMNRIPFGLTRSWLKSNGKSNGSNLTKKSAKKKKQGEKEIEGQNVKYV